MPSLSELLEADIIDLEIAANMCGGVSIGEIYLHPIDAIEISDDDYPINRFLGYPVKIFEDLEVGTYGIAFEGGRNIDPA